MGASVKCPEFGCIIFYMYHKISVSFAIGRNLRYSLSELLKKKKTWRFIGKGLGRFYFVYRKYYIKTNEKQNPWYDRFILSENCDEDKCDRNEHIFLFQRCFQRNLPHYNIAISHLSSRSRLRCGHSVGRFITN